MTFDLNDLNCEGQDIIHSDYRARVCKLGHENSANFDSDFHDHFPALSCDTEADKWILCAEDGTMDGVMNELKVS